MDWLTFLATIIKTSVWPAVVVFGMWWFRRELESSFSLLSKRLATAKAAGISLTFGEQLDILEVALPAPSLDKPVDKADAGATRMQDPDGAKIVTGGEADIEKPPAYIVSQAWLQIVVELQTALRTKHLPANIVSCSGGAIVKQAADVGLLSDADLAQIRDLMTLRNDVVHQDSRAPISLTDALRYRDIANSFINKFREKYRRSA